MFDPPTNRRPLNDPRAFNEASLTTSIEEYHRDPSAVHSRALFAPSSTYSFPLKTVIAVILLEPAVKGAVKTVAKLTPSALARMFVSALPPT